MEKTVNAIFNGEVFRPDEPVELASKVRLVIKETSKKSKPLGASKKKTGKPYSFLEYARSLNLDLPSDYSVNLDEHLYHGKPFPNEE